MCTYRTDTTDNNWDTAEEITISEGASVCDGTDGGCDVDVTITKLGVGSEDDEIIGVVQAYASAILADLYNH